MEPWGRRWPGLYADILQVPAGEEGGLGVLPNLLKEEEEKEDEEEKKEEMEGKRRDEEDMQDSLELEEGIIVKLLLFHFATIAAPASMFFPARRS